MTDKNTTQQLPVNSETEKSDATSNGQFAENKMVSRLQDAIDDKGRYAYRLKDIAIGYAAAKGIKENEAKDEIKASFEKRMGVSLQGYLEQDRLENGLTNDNNSGR
jgi:hypothetical protein